MNTLPASRKTTISIAIAAAGTGGHIFPALAIAQALQAKKISVVWIGSQNGMEHQLLQQKNIPLHSVNFSGLRGKRLRAWLLLPFHLWTAIRQAHVLLRQLQPELVLGMGGYITFPVALACKWQKRKLVIHEQNQLPGTANRYLAPIADRILCGFPNTALRGGITVGNPIRDAFFALPDPQVRAVDRMQKNLPLKVAIIGGSLGAVALNQKLPKALALWCTLDASEKSHQQLEIIHQCGQNREIETTHEYNNAKLDTCIQWKVCSFIDDPAQLFRTLDLLICRAGAQTVSEVAAAGVAALFVPFPYAINDHQTHNAHNLSVIQAGWTMQQSTLSDRALAHFIAKASRQTLAQVGAKARTIAKPQAAQAAAMHCLRLLGLYDRYDQALGEKIS